MRYLLLFLCFLTLSVSAKKKNQVQRPKLVVGIVLDQMRYDFLYRYASRYSNDGFNRLVSQGNSCENTFISYLPSYTGPGHTCIYTGSVPAFHGIASNDWIDRLTGLPVYCTADNQATAVGGTAKAGKMSPKNLWSSTITDELRLATNLKSKVIAISVKDRASILPGGHTANAAYWMDDSNGVFMSSSHYMQSLPNWVQGFNAKDLAKQYMSQGWNTLYPVNSYDQSTQDDNKYEGKFAGETSTSFPHKLSGLRASDIKKTPFGNTIVFDFAKEAIMAEKLGQTESCDFLALSFSSPDYVGHMFGPNSIEIEDTYLRIDLEIASFLKYLDDKIGSKNYTIFLTADHGVAHNPQFLLDQKLPGGFFSGSTLKTSLNQQLAKQFNTDSLIQDVGENFIWLNDKRLASSGLNRQLIIDEILRLVRLRDDIQYAVDMKNIQTSFLPEPIKSMAVNGYVQNRSGDILLLLKPGWLDAYAKTGTTHGTWNPYDTHIPLVWYGWGVRTGQTIRHTQMTDIAATLASLLHIQMPNACVGQAIGEVIK